MKFLYAWLIISLGFLIPVHSQTIIQWPLSTANLGNPTIIENDLQGISFERGNGLSILQFSGSGVRAKNWATGLVDESQVDFYEFGLIAKPDKTIEISDLSFSERRSSKGPRSFALYYSRDEFITQTLVKLVNVPDNIFTRNHNITVDLKIANTEKLHFRLYAFNSESPTGSWTIIANSLELEGSSLAICSPPSNVGSVSITSIDSESIEAVISAGNGQGRLIIVGPEEFDIPAPYQGEMYTGSQVYGDGDCITDRIHVIASTTGANTTLNITNLEEGALYRMAVYEYNIGGMCYESTPMMIDFMTSCTNIPKKVEIVRFTAMDSQVAIRWKKPNCFDKFLVVASEQIITGAPSGISFNADSDFGQGLPAAGFGASVYPVLFTTSANDVVVKTLVNQKAYYFAIYTLVGSQWSLAYEFEAKPVEGCPGQNLERIFINELHYQNSVVAQDQGVEIAGPAGMDLSNYGIIIYSMSNSFNPVFNLLKRYPLFGEIDNEGSGMGAVWFPIPDMPVTKGGIALVNRVTKEEVKFMAYGGYEGIINPYIPTGLPPVLPEFSQLGETSADPAGYSIQRIGSGDCPLDYSWSKVPDSRGILNAGQLILPVVLTKLTVEAKGTAASVLWQTAIEENSDYFIVEHSTDGRYFSQIGKVKAFGFSQESIDYQFMDYQPARGINYYRLKQQDFDGTIHDHGIVSVSFDDSGKETLLVFPNPVDKQATITWQGEAETLKLSDANGRLLRTIVLNQDPEGGHRSMDLSSLPHGAYYLRLEGRDRVETFTVVKS